MKKQRILALVTGRGGSKGLPRKNVLDLCGKPLIAWSIECALEAGLERVVVSTDDDEIAEVASRFGADVPFMRASELASDRASGVDVVIDAVERLAGMGDVYDYVLLLQPTSPLRVAKDIKSAVSLLEEDVDTVVSVCEVSELPHWMKRVADNGLVSDYFSELESPANRQDLDSPFIVNGAIYLAKVSTLLETKSLYGGVTKALIMPRERSVDIDEPLDFVVAESLLNK